MYIKQLLNLLIRSEHGYYCPRLTEHEIFLPATMKDKSPCAKKKKKKKKRKEKEEKDPCLL